MLHALTGIALVAAGSSAINQLIEDFARYLYLPRLKSPEVLLQSIRDGLSLLTWREESFAYADIWDEATKHYKGLRCGEQVSVTDSGLLVKSEIAAKQRDQDSASAADNGSTETGAVQEGSAGGDVTDGGTSGSGSATTAAVAQKPVLYFGSVSLDKNRVGRDAGRIAEEVIAHLTALIGSDVRVTLEIEADVPDGVPDNVVRIVKENGRQLNFKSNEFAEE